MPSSLQGSQAQLLGIIQRLLPITPPSCPQATSASRLQELQSVAHVSQGGEGGAHHCAPSWQLQSLSLSLSAWEGEATGSNTSSTSSMSSRDSGSKKRVTEHWHFCFPSTPSNIHNPGGNLQFLSDRRCHGLSTDEAPNRGMVLLHLRIGESSKKHCQKPTVSWGMSK